MFHDTPWSFWYAVTGFWLELVPILTDVHTGQSIPTFHPLRIIFSLVSKWNVSRLFPTILGEFHCSSQYILGFWKTRYSYVLMFKYLLSHLLLTNFHSLVSILLLVVVNFFWIMALVRNIVQNRWLLCVSDCKNMKGRKERYITEPENN